MTRTCPTESERTMITQASKVLVGDPGSDDHDPESFAIVISCIVAAWVLLQIVAAVGGAQ